MGKSGKSGGIVDRRLIELGESPSDCWRWLGPLNSSGYGTKNFCGKKILAHRWIYQQLFGAIPARMVIDHMCNNRWCVNPHHLQLTTQSINLKESTRRNKLSTAQRNEIRALAQKAGWGELKQIAERFHVSAAYVSAIRKEYPWTLV